MKIKAILLGIWASLAVATLAWSLYIFRYVDSRPNSDAEAVLYGLMTLLTFPAGPLVVMSVGAVFWAIDAPAASVTLPRLIAVWAVMVLGGYFQWFHLVPWIFRTAKAKYAARQSKA
jgi:hypothetical protein